MSIQSINARNQFRGKIKEIILGPVVSEVDVDTPAGIVTSVITTRSVRNWTCRWAPRCWLRQGHRGVGRRFDAGPQPCSGFMWRPRHAAARSGAGRRLLRLSNSRRGLFPNPAPSLFILPLCQNVGHRDRSQIPLAGP